MKVTDLSRPFPTFPDLSRPFPTIPDHSRLVGKPRFNINFDEKNCFNYKYMKLLNIIIVPVIQGASLEIFGGYKSQNVFIFMHFAAMFDPLPSKFLN